MLWIIGVLLIAAALGYWAQRRLLGGRDHDHPQSQAEGLPASELVIPVRTLAALLLAFVLLSAYTSYEDAADSAASEAGAVLAMAEDAVVLDDDTRADVLGTLQCYARSVVGPDWRAQVDHGKPSIETDEASDRITQALDRAREDDSDRVAIGAILSDDSDRVQARIKRLDEGRPGVPWELWILLIATVAIMVGGLAALAHPSVRKRVQLGVLVGTTIVFGLTLLVIHDLDRPYDGPAKIEPDAMRNVERRIVGLPGGAFRAPCDAEGRALDA